MRVVLFCAAIMVSVCGVAEAAKLSNVHGTVTTTYGGATRVLRSAAGEVAPGSIVTAKLNSGAIVNYRNGCFQIVRAGQSVQVERAPVCDCTAAESQRQRAKGDGAKKCLVVPGANRWSFAPALPGRGLFATPAAAVVAAAGAGAVGVITHETIKRRNSRRSRFAGGSQPSPPVGPGGQPFPQTEGRSPFDQQAPLSP